LIEFGKFVIWNLNAVPLTQRPDLYWIWEAFDRTLKKMGVPVAWVDATPESLKVIQPGDIVIVSDLYDTHLRYVPGAKFVTYNLGSKPWTSEIPPEDRLVLQVTCAPVYDRDHIDVCPYDSLIHTDGHGRDVSPARERWDNTTFFSKEERCLYQPWGTDLTSAEFRDPVAPSGDASYWVGSVWNNEENQGNLGEVEEMRLGLRSCGVDFEVRRATTEENIELVRSSRLAPAIAGRWAVEHNYLPCRAFKNVSYGQLGITNVPMFRSIFDGCSLQSDSIAGLIEEAFSLSDSDYVEMTRAQQKCITNQGYDFKVRNILRALEAISGT